MKIMKKLILISIVFFTITVSSYAQHAKPVSFVTGIGSSAFQAQDIAYRTAWSNNMKVVGHTTQKISKNNWVVILKTISK